MSKIILTYGTELEQVPHKCMSTLLATEESFIRRLTGLSERNKVKNEIIRKILGADKKPDIIVITENKYLCWNGHVQL